ncbi:MAG: T9SS type A sorting domain-containing protein [Bacteroidales bacterium]|nr:T9SS type A sorting domain-containing protein [Bacteroidales bacterium]
MKTKLITLAVLLLSSFAMKAQQGEIVYNDYDPDSILVISNEGFMLIDLDGEGSPDIKMSYYTESPGAVFPFIESCYPDSIMVCATGQDSILSEIEEYSGNLGFEIVLTNHHYGFRIKHAEEYYYGWFETYLEWVGKDDRRVLLWGFDRIAFCTIPDYPLVWGQIDLVGIEESDEPATFTTVHPNPTTGLVTITGDNLRQAEVLNMLGQQMLSVQGKGNEFHINMTVLPAGIYFVTITDDEGRKCVRKVVKE